MLDEKGREKRRGRREKERKIRSPGRGPKSALAPPCHSWSLCTCRTKKGVGKGSPGDLTAVQRLLPAWTWPFCCAWVPLPGAMAGGISHFWPPSASPLSNLPPQWHRGNSLKLKSGFPFPPKMCQSPLASPPVSPPIHTSPSTLSSHSRRHLCSSIT